jgi:hypothetical protein
MICSTIPSSIAVFHLVGLAENTGFIANQAENVGDIRFAMITE